LPLVQCKRFIRLDCWLPQTMRFRELNLWNSRSISSAQSAVAPEKISGVNTQDFALQEGMGPIVDRSKEHLGSSAKRSSLCGG